MKWLTKKWSVDQTTIELIMAADKQAQQGWFKQLKTEGVDFLILDRYTLSQAVYGIATGSDGRWLLQLHNYMRKPDLDIVIDIPAEVSMKRKGKHNNGINDRYESDLTLLKNVRNYYNNVSTFYSAPVKRIVNGEQDVESVHNDLFCVIQGVFKL
jgi:dTMP kinase